MKNVVKYPALLTLLLTIGISCSDKKPSEPLAMIDGNWKGLMVLKQNNKVRQDSVRINFDSADSSALLVLDESDSFQLRYKRNHNKIKVTLPDDAFGRQTSRIYSGTYDISNLGGANKLKLSSGKLLILLEKDSVPK
jgi:hypothetical protein